MNSIPFDVLKRLGAELGLAIVSISTPEDLIVDQQRLDEWQRAGYAGEMSFMQREPGLFASPKRLLTEVTSIVTIGAYYDRRPREPLQRGYGRVARYAWGRDYHKVLRSRLTALCESVAKELKSPFQYRLFSDSVPLLERAIARRAGMGFIGKNTMLIIPRAGSFLFLGEILWDLEVIDLPLTHAFAERSCGSCSRCMQQCPTSAFVSDHILDARRCISYLTIEKRTALSWQEREWIGEWLFGCDVCQEVCPFNARALKHELEPDLPEFGASYGAGQSLPLHEILSIRTHEALVARFAGTPIMRAKREGLLRNAAIVAANTSAISVLPDLERAFYEDPAPLVRQHAVWSHRLLSVRLGSRDAAKSDVLLDRAEADPDVSVREEALKCRVLPLQN